MAASVLKSAVRRHCRLQKWLHNRFPFPAVVSFLVMVLLTTDPSSAEKLPSGQVKFTEPAPADENAIHHKNTIEGHLHMVSTLAQDSERLQKLLLAGQPVVPKERILYEIEEGDNGSYLYIRAPSPSDKKGDELQLSSKKYKLTKKPYRKLVILDSYDTSIDQLRNTSWAPEKVVKDLGGGENEENSNVDYPDQEMAESAVIIGHDHSEAKRSQRLPRSAVTGHGFLGVFSGLHGFGVDEGQSQNPFHVPIAYGGSEPSISQHTLNNHQQHSQEGQWNIPTPKNTHRFPGALYPLQQSPLQSRNGRGNNFPETPVDERESFHNGEYTRSTMGGDYNKNTFHENIRNFISQTNFFHKKSLQNKKRDLSREHVTLGENEDAVKSQTTTLYRSSTPEEPNKFDRSTLENTAMRIIMRGGEQWDKIGRGELAKQFRSVSQHESVGYPSQHDIPVAESPHVLSILPLVDRSSEYDHVIDSVPTVEDMYSVAGSGHGGTFVLENGDQRKFWFEGGGGLLHDNIFSRADAQSGLSPIVEPQMGLRIFKRSASTGGIRRSAVPHLVKKMQEGRMSATLSKRSPLSTGYVAGIGTDADHHQHHEHMAVAATGGALHQDHHHDILPPAVILSSGHHNDDTAHHLVAKSETTVAGSAGGAGSGRGPNQEDSGPGALVVLHPPHQLVAAHADDDTIHVIAAVPFAVAHHHELHHEVDHVLSKSTTLTLAPHDSDPHVLAKTTTVTTVTQHASAPLLVVHTPDSPVVLLHHPAASQSSTSTTTVHKPPVPHNLLRVPLGGFGVGVTFGGAGAGHGFYAAG